MVRTSRFQCGNMGSNPVRVAKLNINKNTSPCSSVWLEHSPCKREVGSSNLSQGHQFWGYNSIVRVSALQAESCRLESDYLHQYWSVRSSVRMIACHAIEKGPTPLQTAIKFFIKICLTIFSK